MNAMTGIRDGDTAVIGMAGRFPGSADVRELWSMLLDGRTGITDVETPAGADDRWVPRAAALEDPALFDASFYSIGDREALLMDPQHRVLLDVVWEALEDAGHERASGSQDVRVGVFTASSPSMYLMRRLRDAGLVDLRGIDYPALLGNEKDFLSARISYQLDLHGPSVTVQSACSSSLVCVHLARLALQAGDCDLAVVGGVSIGEVREGYRYLPGGIMSPDGSCHPFEAAARGTIRGEGAAAVVLRRCEDARRDRDRIIAVIAGSAVTNDGRLRVGFSAPGVYGQSTAMTEAMAEAGVTGADIDYVETHGTGTALGDAIELRSLRTAHERSGGLPTGCRLGSLKANIGHLDAAAGVAGLMKTALVVENQQIPGQPGFGGPSAELAALGEHYVMSGETIRATVGHAAVSSFGMGGTDAHAVLVPAPRDERPELDPGATYRFTLSARDEEALRARMGALAEWIARERPRGDDLAWTLDQAWRYPIRRSMTGTLDEFAAWCAAGRVRLPEAHEEDGPGEVPDWSSARRLAVPPHPRRPRRFWPDEAPDGQPDGQEVLRSATQFLRLPGIGPDEDLFDHGVDSMSMLQLLGFLHDEHGIDVDLEDFIVAPRLSTVLAARGASTPPAQPAGTEGPASPAGTGDARDAGRPADPVRQPVIATNPVSLLRPRWHVLTERGNRQLTLVHPAGGTTACYVPIARRSTSGWTWKALASGPGAEERRPTIRELAAGYVEALLEDDPADEFVLGGYSLGGNVAFEMAEQLIGRGRTVRHLILLDSYAPEVYLTDRDRGEIIEAFAMLLPSAFPQLEGAGIPTGASTVREVLDDMCGQLGVPPVRGHLLAETESFYATWTSHHAALDRWLPDRVLDVPTTLAYATGAPHPVMTHMGIRSDVGAWARHLSRLPVLRQVPGNHFSIVEEEDSIRVLAEVIDEVLSALDEETDDGETGDDTGQGTDRLAGRSTSSAQSLGRA